jgi:hypothetical protein
VYSLSNRKDGKRGWVCHEVYGLHEGTDSSTLGPDVGGLPPLTNLVTVKINQNANKSKNKLRTS